MAIVKRLNKGATLTYAELDGNFDHLTAEDAAVRAEFAAADALHAALTDNPHSVTATQVGLGNVDNTADIDKPVSTATTTAIGVAVAVPQGDIDDHIADTAGAHADSAITFTPAGTGAVATTVQAKLRESVSVKDFGATGDGSTDDTDAIQAFFDAAAAANRTAYLNGGGTYIVDTVVVPDGLVLIGDKQTTLKLKDDATGSLLNITSNISDIHIEGVIFDGNYAGQTVKGDLIHSIIYGRSPETVTNATITDNVFNDACGCHIGYQLAFITSTISFNNFNNHYQGAVDIDFDKSLFHGNRIINTGDCRGTAYPVSTNGDYNTFSNNYVVIGTTGVTADNVWGCSGDYNTYTENTIDCALGDYNWGFSANPGTGNKFTNNTIKSSRRNVDFELLGQINCVATGNVHIDSHGLYALNGNCVNVSISSFSADMMTSDSTVDAVRLLNTSGNAAQNVSITDFHIDGSNNAFTIAISDGLQIANGTITNSDGVPFDLGSGTHTNFFIDNILIDTAPKFLTLTSATDGCISNIVLKNITAPKIEQYSCSNIAFSNIQGIETGLTGSYGPHGKFDGILIKTYGFGVQGGDVGTIDLLETIPKNSIIKRFSYYVRSALTSGTSAATVAFGLVGDTSCFKAATIISDASFAATGSGFHAGIIDGAEANYKKITAAANLSMTIAVEDLTAGFVIIYVEYSPTA